MTGEVLFAVYFMIMKHDLALILLKLDKSTGNYLEKDNIK